MTIARATAELFAPDGVTSIGQLTNARAIKWQDELSKVGTASFEIPLDDTITASITDRCVVKFTLYGAVRYGCRIVSEAVQLAVDGRRWLRFENQPGLLQLLGDAVVMPEYGLARQSPASRIFGFMSIDGPWRITADWQAPIGVAWSADVPRAGFPPDLNIENPDWLGYVNPDTSVTDGSYNFFRSPFTITGTDVVVLEFTFTADNFLTLYLDGAEIISADPTHPFGWRTTSKASVALAPGGHLLAAKVLNGVGIPTANNSMGLIGVIYVLDPATGERSAPFMQTNTTDWIVTNDAPIPGWTRAQVLKKLVEEAQARTAFGPTLLTLGFTDTDDTASVTWADAPGEYTFSVGTVSLSDVASQLSESAMDVEVDTDTMTLNAWVRKGTDLSATIELKLGDADGTLKADETTSTSARFTDVLTQLSDGSWVQTTDATAVTAVGGHIEVGLTLGSTSAADSATAQAEALLAESAIPQIGVTGEPSTLAGAQAYIDYQLGDTIKVPGHRNVGTMKARVLSITVDNTGDVLRAWPEFVQDLSV